MNTKLLFSPVRINALMLKNRIILPSMVTNYALNNGEVSDQMINYHVERAQGGCGLNMVEAAYVDPSGNSYRFGLGIDSDDKIDGLKRMTDAVHAVGGRMGMQLQHGGRLSNPATNRGPVRLVSYVPGVTSYENSRVLTEKEIGDIVNAYALAARRAQEAGFDLIELHGAHGYLINQFLSPFTNRREDAYGGTPEKRRRFLLEVLQACRQAVGKDFPIMCRLTVDEFFEAGLTLDLSKGIAAALVDNGVDALNISVGAGESRYYTIPPACVPEAFNADRAGAIREAVGARVPVAVVGRINSAGVAERVLQSGKADMVVMGRALIADPELPLKSANGLEDTVVPCIACNEGCSGGGGKNQTMSCALNPRTGQEGYYPNVKATVIRKVLVVGAGPAGMAAALTAAQRGHAVTLMDASRTPGGLLTVAKLPPHKAIFQNVIDYYQKALQRAGVEVCLGKTVGVADVQAMAPDMTIVATGSKPIQPHFCEGVGAFFAEEVLRGKEVGQRVLILGGGMVGCETAEFLSGQGKDVTVLELRDALAADLVFQPRYFLLDRLNKEGVHSLLNTEVLEISCDGRVKVRNNAGRETMLEKFDTLVFSLGYRAESSLYHELCEAGLPATRVGDCVRPGKVMHAIHQGFEAAYAL